jgi:hypothetical protein
MLCELQRHVLRTFSHGPNEAIKPLAILQKLKCKSPSLSAQERLNLSRKHQYSPQKKLEVNLPFYAT